METKLSLHIYRIGPENHPNTYYIALLNDNFGKRERLPHIRNYENLPLEKLLEIIVAVNKYKGKESDLLEKLDNIHSN